MDLDDSLENAGAFGSHGCFFFFQAEDGIRDLTVTGVQTCALPIWAVHKPSGLDVPDVLTWVRERRQLAGYPRGEALNKDQLLTVECDVLVPAATENVITRKNAPPIKAKTICEGANGPTTAAADEILRKKGIFVIPDILANAGGVTVSYFE